MARRLLEKAPLSGLFEYDLQLWTKVEGRGRAAVIHVRTGKGPKDRYVPLPERTLAQLRRYWRQHRQPKWLFPGRGLASVAR